MELKGNYELLLEILLFFFFLEDNFLLWRKRIEKILIINYVAVEV